MAIKIGILSFAHMHAASYADSLDRNPNVELIGIWDADSTRGRSAAAEFHTAFYPDISALLSAGLDGVIVTAENVRHREMVEQAAEAGVRAILCEKPLATTVDDAVAMIASCERSGTRLATAFPCRYSPVFRRLRAEVAAGRIGTPIAVSATNRGSMPGGWFVEKALSGGGAVIDHTVHVADLNRLLLGQEARQVYAEIGNGFYHQEWDDTGFLTIQYDGGVFATLDTSWSRPKTYPIWGDVTMEIIGSEGIANASLFEQNVTHYDDSANRVLWRSWGSNIDALMIDDFLRLGAGEEAPDLATGDDGLRAVAVALAAYRSAESGEPEPIAIASGSSID